MTSNTLARLLALSICCLGIAGCAKQATTSICVLIILTTLISGCGRKHDYLVEHATQSCTKSLAAAKMSIQNQVQPSNPRVSVDEVHASHIDATSQLYASTLEQMKDLQSHFILTPSHMSNLPRNVVIILRDRMYSLYAKKNYTESTVWLKLLLHCDALSRDERIPLIRVLGVCLKQQNKLTEAEPCFDEVLKHRLSMKAGDLGIDSDALGACFALADIYASRNQQDQVIDVSRRGWQIAQASKLNASVVDARGLCYASVLINSRRYDEARQVLTTTQWRDESSAKQAKSLLERLPEYEARAQLNTEREAAIEDKIHKLTPEQRRRLEEKTRQLNRQSESQSTTQYRMGK